MKLAATAFALAALGSAACPPARGAQLSAEALVLDCASADHGVKSGVCVGYVAGVVDTLSQATPLCIPRDVSVAVIAAMIPGYIERHVKDLGQLAHMPASDIVSGTVTETFSCPSAR